MKKFLSVCLCLLMMQSVALASSFRGEFLDPFNNDLFEIVAETSYYNDFNMDFDTYETIYSEDYSQAKVVHIEVAYNGEVTQTDICDFTDPETAQTYLPEDPYLSENPYEFNDGLIRFYNSEIYLSGYNDIAEECVYLCPTEQYFIYDYNMGLLTEMENDGWAGKDIAEREYKTTFTKIMTDNQTYEFNCKIYSFNDDGYSLMRANDKTYVIKLKSGIIPTVTYNGEKIKFDQIPVIENGRTLVPLRAIFEKIGASVDWDESTQTVIATKDGITVNLPVNNPVATKNGEEFTLETPAKIINGRTLVPVRFVADCFGVAVDWDDVLKRVVLTD